MLLRCKVRGKAGRGKARKAKERVIERITKSGLFIMVNRVSKFRDRSGC